MVRDWLALVPQVFEAVTVIVPPFVFGVTVILLVVEVPVQPNGNTQL
jgi:hypothetical protein